MVLHLEFNLLDGRLALTQLPPGSAAPVWARGQFVSITQSPEGISVVSDEAAVPADLKTRGGFRCLEIAGAFELSSVGVLAAAVQPLSEAGVSLFAYSTWETDYILVHGDDLHRATAALTKAGHKVR
ncbi:MAG TPA: ACT domain-containing protein [Stellaceae bacterium]|nr:ACT domain-containing protein [Stellaceae bacterium]